MDEEARAAAYRAKQQERIDWEQQNAARLQGNPVLAADVRAAWQPWVDARRERFEIEPDPEERHDRRRWSPA